MEEKTSTFPRMKEAGVPWRRLSMCPPPTLGQKIDPRSLMRNFSYGDNDGYPQCTGSEMERNGGTVLNDEPSPSPSPTNKLELKFESQEAPSPSEKLLWKDFLKVQKKNYQQKKAAKEVYSAQKDSSESEAIMSNWLKIRGTLKGWTKLWCVLKPGALLIYKSPKVDHWVGTILLNACTLMERPSKKDGFCFKLYHPLDRSIWAMKGPQGENVGSITQPLPSSYLIFRAASEPDGRCWMGALELALSSSNLDKFNFKASPDGDIACSSESSHIFNLLRSPSTDHVLSQLSESMEQDCNSDKSEKETHDSDNGLIEDGGRLTEESDMDQSDDLLHDIQATVYVEEEREEMAEEVEMSQVETVSEENKSLIWTLLKQLRPGMDLSKVVLPTFILEPRSFLDKLSDYYYHADFLSQAVTAESPYCRIKHILRWYLSGFYKKPKGMKKPYNPILGETFRCCWLHPQASSCTFYIAEQVSHHPPISAFYVNNRKDGFCIHGSILAKSKFYGNSLSAILDGNARVILLTRDEEYVITMPYAHCKGILYGTMTMELGGKVTIDCKKTNYVVDLEFKLKPLLSSSTVNQISGKILIGEDVLATVDGHWDREVFLREKKTGHQEVLWNPSLEVRHQRLQRKVVPLDLQGEFESQRLWQHVTSAIVNQDQELATQEKFVLEEAQRQEARQRGDIAWTPRLFTLDPTTNEWRYKHADTNPWDADTCLAQFEKDNVIQTKERQQRQQKESSYGQSWAVRKEAHTRDKRRKPNYSQNTESSTSTPEPLLESSDNEEFLTQCARCNKELRDMAQIEAYIASIQKTQKDIQRNLRTLRQQILHSEDSGENIAFSGRYFVILCVLLLFQLFINYVYT
uniref:Oxysterol-binding protein n=1 Tax=Paramormyrops kingsleyae TaxID=1676925 RepID=A0A3B3SXW9_9TELE|nr:oxysterol-binding protein-related protein 5-like isoform X1 [Paramormyrops kingsleyae]XP_023660698.1 oxysterol-binding protein-related protein 5-like isoform X1 [Paramormyrops kingsleyae]